MLPNKKQPERDERKKKKMKNEKFDELMEVIDDVELQEMLFECISYDGSFDWLDYQENDEYFFENYFRTKDEVARAICFGSYNYSDEFVKFNAYGNLESTSRWQMEDEINENKEEIIAHYLELYEANHTYPSSSLEEKLNAFYEEDEEGEDDDE